MKHIINQIISQSKFTVSAFAGKLLLEGRILSPSEAHAAGLTSGLLAAAMADPKQLQAMSQIKDDGTDQNFEEILQLAKRIRPENIEAMGEAHDKILCRVIKRASSDNGETWQNIILVEGVDQQDAEKNRLWVGMIPEDDRKQILDHALQGHKKAVESIRGSL